MAADGGERFGDPSGAIATEVEQLYRVFRRYPTVSQMEACPCGCMNRIDQARVHAHPLRELSAEDLDQYVGKAMTTWGDENDYRHYLPRIFELGVSSEADSYYFVELAYSKLHDAGWRSWPEAEQVAISSFLTTRWSVGLTQNPPSTIDPTFDAADWLNAVAPVIDTSPLIETWRRAGAAGTIGHIAWFLESNPRLLTAGELGVGHEAACFGQPEYAQEMRTWLTALVHDPDFQDQLAAWYQQ